MSSNRMINTCFWNDSWIQELDPSEKLLYMYLITSPQSNIAGIYKITLKSICFDTGFNTDTVNKILDRFAEKGKTFLLGEYIVIPSFPKNQNLESNNIRRGIEQIIRELPPQLISLLANINYSFDLKQITEDLHIPYGYPLKTLEEVSKGYKYPSRYLNLNLNLNYIKEGEKSPLNPLVSQEKLDVFDILPQDNKDFDLNTDTQTPKIDKKQNFIKPTLEEIKEYVYEKSYTFNPEMFYEFYESKGWFVGKNKMKDWKSACRTWQLRQKDNSFAQTINNDSVQTENFNAFTCLSAGEEISYEQINGDPF